MADGDPIIIGRDNIASNPGAETILRRDADSTRTDPVFTVQNDTGVGVRGTSTVAEGVVGKASHDDVAGVLGTTTRADGIGVRGMNRAGGLAVSGFSAGGGGGVDGTSDSGFGVSGITTSGIGVRGETASPSPSKAAFL
jgi:hypothetical protein